MQQDTGRKRHTIDKFYTRPEIASRCLSVFLRYVGDLQDSVLIEPSAGGGAFSDILPKSCSLAFDIQPTGHNIKQQDFLQLSLEDLGEKLHFIGNPPFGRQSSLARKFIKHICACRFSLTIGFILPRSFKKDSLCKTFPLHYHMAYCSDLPSDAFTLNGEPYNVPCVFQVWVRKGHPREIPKSLAPQSFMFVTRDQAPDFSIRRVGVYAGEINTETQSKSPQSHYFIRLCHGQDIVNFLERFRNIQFVHNNTVGPRSISKQELIKAITTCM